MNIDDCFPTPLNLLKCEFETLKFFKSNFFGNQELNKLAKDADDYYPNYYKLSNYSKVKDHHRLIFRFESTVDIKVDGKEGIAHIGSQIESRDTDKIGRTTYYAAICRKEEKRILRKYHFDYEPPGKPHRQPHPVFHLQYAGKLSSRLKKMNIADNHLDTWLSEPRLCCFPLSLALLINLIMMEFPDEKNKKLIERSEWRNLIKSNEDRIIAPFFKVCNSFFSNKKESKLFINDFYYGN